MKLQYLFVLIFLLGACRGTQEKKAAPSARLNMEIDTTNFCKVCDSLEMWQGGIQGVDVGDSTGGYPMAECHTNKFFDIIWTPKGDILKFKSTLGSEALDNYYETSAKSNYENLDCYVFLIPKTKHISKKNEDPNCDCEDLDTFDYVFPSKVSILKKVNGGFTLINKKRVNSFEELGRLKLNTIFGIQ